MIKFNFADLVIIPVASITRHDFYILDLLVRDQWVLISGEMTVIYQGHWKPRSRFPVSIVHALLLLNLFLQLEFFTAIQFFYLFLWFILEPTEELQVSIITSETSSLIFYFTDDQEISSDYAAGRLWFRRHDSMEKNVVLKQARFYTL